MIKLIMVEDDDRAADILRSHIVGYEKEKGVKFEAVRYKDAVAFFSYENLIGAKLLLLLGKSSIITQV